MENKKIKVLFVSSGNSMRGISSIVKNQGESLKKNGIELDYFTIKGKGILGYIKNIPILMRYLKNNNYDIIHAHYSKSAYVASLASFGMNIPVICSLMGSDIQTKNLSKFIIRIFYTFFWKRTIVKSERMKNKISFIDAEVIPNGISFDKFSFIPKEKAQREIGFDSEYKNIIWVSNPNRYEKNFSLAEEAVKLLNKSNIKLQVVNNVNHSDIPKYMYAADMLLLTSLWEGSPNVVKEAMACNLPIVSTDVGDVEWLFGDEKGYYIADFKPEDVADKIRLSIEYKGKPERTNGRERIIKLELDSETVARKIINVYNRVG